MQAGSELPPAHVGVGGLPGCTKQIIELPPPVDPSMVDTKDQKIIREEEVKTIAKRQLKLTKVLKWEHAIVFNQCLIEVWDKVEVSDKWDKMQQEQYLHDQIHKNKCICVGFDDHKRDVFHLVQVLKALFLHTQEEKEGVDEYRLNFRSLQDTVNAFGGSPGVHRGLVEGLLRGPNCRNNETNIMSLEPMRVEEDPCKARQSMLCYSSQR
jgi:hypothetical protein